MKSVWISSPFLLSEGLSGTPVNRILTVLLRMNVYRITIDTGFKFLKNDAGLSGVKQKWEYSVKPDGYFGINPK